MANFGTEFTYLKLDLDVVSVTKSMYQSIAQLPFNLYDEQTYPGLSINVTAADYYGQVIELISNDRQSNLLTITKPQGGVQNCSAQVPGKGIVGMYNQPMTKGKGSFKTLPVHQACGPKTNYPHPTPGQLDISINTPWCK